MYRTILKKKLSTNMLENTIPVGKDPKRSISQPKQNRYTIFTSKRNKKTISSSKTIYIRNSTNKPVPNTLPSVSLSSIPSKHHLEKKTKIIIKKIISHNT